MIILALGETGDHMDKIKILLVEQDDERRKEIVRMLQNVEYLSMTGLANTLEEAERILENKTIDVVLIDSKADGNGYDISEKLYSQYSEAAIIMLEDELHEDTLRKAVFSGAKDVLIHPLIPSKMVDAIYKANQHQKESLLSRKDSTPKIRRKNGLGQVYAVFGTKGGVGKTLIAINLAVGIAKMTGKKVALIDLDLEFGDIALSLNVSPKFTIADIVDDIRNIDQDLIESYMIAHDSGIKILPSHSRPMMNDFMNAEDIDIILRTLQSTFDFVVIDMPSRFVDIIQPAFAIADKLLIVTTPDVSSLRNTKTALITLNELNYPKSKIKIILNKVNKRDTIKKKDVETTLNADVIGSIICESRIVSESLNTGQPIMASKSSRTINKDFLNLVKRLTDSSHPIKTK